MATANQSALARVRWRDAGLLLVVFLLVAVVGRDFLRPVENHYREIFQSVRAAGASERIVLIDMPATGNEAGAARYLADVITALGLNGASQIVSVVPTPDALSTLDREQLETLADLEALVQQSGEGAAPAAPEKLRERLGRLREQGAGMAALVSATAAAGNVFLALPEGRPGERLQGGCLVHAVGVPTGVREPVLAAMREISVGDMPDALCRAAAGIGYLIRRGDGDATSGQAGLLAQANGVVIPELATAVAAAAEGTPGRKPTIADDGSLRLGRVRVGMSSHYDAFNHAYGELSGGPPFTVISSADLLAGRVPPERLRGRIALIGRATPASSDASSFREARESPPAVAVAIRVSNYLNGDFVLRPLDVRKLEAGLALLAVVISLVLSWLARPVVRGGVTVALVLTMLATQGYLLIAEGIWFELTSAVIVLLLGAGSLELLRSFSPPLEARPAGIPAASRGPADEGHGNTLVLEFAFLRHQPNDAKTKASLYDLAVRYARARELAQAERVLRHLAMLDPHYRRVRKKLAKISGLRARKNEHALDARQDVTPQGVLPADESWGDRREAERREPDQRSRKGRRQIDQISSTEAPTLKRLGRYNLLRELGAGAMAHVYLAEDPTLRRQVAIKTLALAEEFGDADLEGARQQFTREAESAGRLNHPSIIAIHDFGEEHGLSYIVMEYFPGKPASAYIAPENLLPAGWVLELAAQAADALSYAHEKNVIHRDIKPANLMYDPATDTLKISDFGIARLTDTKRTRSGIIMGTPTYMAPEQFRGEQVDGRADLYSLGVTIYQLLTGSAPFRALSIEKLLDQVINQQHEPVSALRSDLPPLIDEVLSQALAKDPAKRFANARAMAAALRACSRAVAA